MKEQTTGEIKNELNFEQERFCQIYAGGGEFCGNGVWSYIIAYNKDVPLIAHSYLNDAQKKEYNEAKADASRLITNDNIIKRCNELFDALIKDEIVDRELIRVITQNEELSAKVSAIKEYNAVRKRVEAPKTIINIGKTLDELEKE